MKIRGSILTLVFFIFHFVQGSSKNIEKAQLEAESELLKWSEVSEDTVSLQERMGVVTVLEGDFELQSKEGEIARLESEHKLVESVLGRVIRLGTLFIILLLLTLGLGYFYFRNNRLKLEVKLAEVKEGLLRLQINPHFIFNTLNSIQSSLLQNDEERTVHIFNKFSTLMRQVLYNSETPFAILRDELDLLGNYMELEKIRSNDKFDYEIKIDDDVNTYQAKVPSMILQIFVENSIWHGIGPKSDRGHLSVLVSRKEGKHQIIIKDDGVGRAFSMQMKSKDQKRKKSMGTILARQRIEQLNQKYGRGLQLVIEDRAEGMGTEVRLSC